MAFVNEVVSDADIDKYKLPFAKGGGRYWTRDAERDFYLWGGWKGNPALGEDPEWLFDLMVEGQLVRVSLARGNGSKKFSEDPYVISWKSVALIAPPILLGLSMDYIISTLKQALSCYGRDGEENLYTPNRVVEFDF
jgi:hypothetical protein